MIPGIDGILNIGSKLIDKLWPNPEEKARAQAELMKLAQDGQLEELRVSLSAIIAEANSSDPWTSRARPSFLYVVYAYILFGIPVSVLAVFRPSEALLLANALQAYLASIPEMLWGAFTAGYLGYGYFRMKDKNNGHS